MKRLKNLPNIKEKNQYYVLDIENKKATALLITESPLAEMEVETLGEFPNVNLITIYNHKGIFLGELRHGIIGHILALKRIARKMDAWIDL